MEEIRQQLKHLMKRGIQFLGVALLGFALNFGLAHSKGGMVYKINQTLTIFSMFVALCYFTGMAYKAFKGNQEHQTQEFSKYYITMILLFFFYIYQIIQFS